VICITNADWDANADKTNSQWQVKSRTVPLSERNWRIDTTIQTPSSILTQQDEANDKTTWMME
jgi:hypothetical protein